MSIDVFVPKGLYVVAVSGGVDSVTLLDVLSKLPEVQLVVAHFDHGIRQDSGVDRLLVQKLAKKYNLAFEYKQAKLGPRTSEEAARKARYDFLNSVKKCYGARAIITAHHQDDVIETAILNLMRGTGRRGITSLQSNDLLLRPLLHVSKKEIIDYAKQNSLAWHEDSTNSDTSYLRNYVRLQLLPRFSTQDKTKLVDLINQTTKFNKEVDQELAKELAQHMTRNEIDRHWFIMLPYSVAKEIMATWLRQQGLAAYDRKTLDRAVVASKTFRANTQVDIYNDYSIIVKKEYLALTGLDR